MFIGLDGHFVEMTYLSSLVIIDRKAGATEQMKPFNQLTPRGQVRRLRQLALKTVEAYAINVRRVRLLIVDTNTLFRVEAADGRKYALRICRPGEHTLTEIEAEMTWLQALNAGADVNVPKPVLNKNGRPITTTQIEGVPGSRHCVLFDWIPGRPLEEHLSPKTYYQLGQTAAKLHIFAESYTPPANFQPMVWNRIFYYGAEPVVIFEEANQHFFSAKQMSIIKQTMALAEAELQRLFAQPQSPIILHGDMHMWNVHVYRGKLFVLDFEDTMWGYPVQDVAITLTYGRFRDDYPPLRAAYQEGYSSLRPWPVQHPHQIATLIAARTVMFINYVTHKTPTEAPEYIAGACERLQTFLNEIERLGD